MPMKNPPHPGGVVLRQCIEPLGLTITGAAAALGERAPLCLNSLTKNAVSRRRWRSGFRRFLGGSPQSWLTQQAHYDLAQIEPSRIKLRKLHPA
jgi:antitoxin HigA-1